MKRCAILALLVGLALGSVPGAAADDSGQPLDSEAAELVAEMADLLDQALYLAIAALSWPDRDDLPLYIQGILNLIESSSSPYYDDTGGATTPDGKGLKDLYLEFLTLRLTRTEADANDVPGSLVAQAWQATEHVEMYFFMAAEAAKNALERAYSVTAAQEELRAMYAYLLAARGRADDELVLGGIAALVEVFPTLNLHVEPGLSLQATIDRAPAGATIHLDPGTYRERIVIDKDLTLVGAPSPDGEASPPSTILMGPVWDFVVAVEGDGVEVRLENLMLSGGKTGLSISDGNAAELDIVWITEVSSGIGATAGAIVDCDVCRIGDCETALLVASGASALVSQSEIFDCTSSGALLLSGGSLTMTDSEIRDCAEHGIYLQEDAVLHLERCSIVGNGNFGVFAYSAECELHWIPGQTSGYGFSGTITGANNTIPGADEDHGNRKGDVCPEEYRSLKQPGLLVVPPAVDPPSGSIQTAVDAAAEGASILIPEGTYREGLRIEKPIILLGEGEVILMPDSEEDPAITVSETSGAELRGLEFEGGTGIEIRTASCQVADCTFRTTDLGASVIIFGADTVDFERCTFAGEDRGKGVQLLGDGIVGIDECRFSDLGAGASVGGLVSATIRGSSFRGCYEGVTLASSAIATIEENRFERCYAAGIRVSQAPETSPAGSLVLNGNRFMSGGTWDISLCGFEGTGELQFLGSLSGTGNVVEGGIERLCPTDYDWPEGFLEE